MRPGIYYRIPTFSMSFQVGVASLCQLSHMPKNCLRVLGCAISLGLCPTIDDSCIGDHSSSSQSCESKRGFCQEIICLFGRGQPRLTPLNFVHSLSRSRFKSSSSTRYFCISPKQNYEALTSLSILAHSFGSPGGIRLRPGFSDSAKRYLICLRVVSRILRILVVNLP
jgi:hypothetical protein